jgi:hypothetical protein
MQTLYLLLFTELSLLFTPLQELYSQYGFLVTHSWIKMLWEKVFKFNIKVMVTDLAQKLPREGNQFIMHVLLRGGYAAETLL